MELSDLIKMTIIFKWRYSSSVIRSSQGILTTDNTLIVIYDSKLAGL